MPASLCRVALVGGVGCGKTSLARELACRICVPHIELDALKYQPGWVEVSNETFRSKVVALAGTDRWVIDGNYADVQDLIWLRAQILVWLDFPLPVTLWRLIRRTIGRLLTKEPFADGNKEQFRRMFSSQSVLVWAIRSHRRRRQHYEELLTYPRYAHLQVVRLRSPSAVGDWLAGMPESVQGSKIELN